MQKNEQNLGKDPVGPLLLKLAIPTIIAQLVNLLYNLVDRIYIGHIPVVGDMALTGKQTKLKIRPEKMHVKRTVILPVLALGQAKFSLFIACLRKVTLLIPLIYILPFFFADKVFAVFLAEPMADLLSVITAGSLFTFNINKILEKPALGNA